MRSNYLFPVVRRKTIVTDERPGLPGQGVGISNKPVTPSNALSSARQNVVSQTKNVMKATRSAKLGRYVKLSVATLLILGIAGTQLAGRASSEQRYVAPQARLENPIETPDAQPVDQVVAAEVAAAVAEEADLLITPNVANHADTLDAQVSTTTKTEDNQSGVIEKPQLIAASGKSINDIQTITVETGDTVDSLAVKYGISADTIKWENNLGSSTVAPGTQLRILPVTGLTYTVQSGDTAESIASKFQTSSESVTAYNDVEVKGLPAGSKIIVPGGVKPAATPVRRSTSSTSSSSSARFSFGGGVLYAGNRYAYGYCTYYAYNKRAAAGRPIGSNWGNATTWASLARASGFSVDKSPRAGDVFQTSGGWGGYGHVGYVERVNDDGSIFVSEMNYAGWNRVSSRTISADQVGLFNYIH